MLSVVGRGLLVNLQVRDTLIIFEVASHQGKMVMESGSSNKEIVMVSRLSEMFCCFAGSEVPTKNRAPLSNGSVNPKHLYSSYKAVKHLCMLLGMVAVVDPFIDFHDFHVAHNAHG